MNLVRCFNKKTVSGLGVTPVEYFLLKLFPLFMQLFINQFEYFNLVSSYIYYYFYYELSIIQILVNY